MIEGIFENAQQIDFYKAVFLVENQLKTADSSFRHIGYDSQPKLELIKFSVTQGLGFPGNAISKIESNGYSDNFHQVTMHISFMGMTGCSGALPQYYTELVLQRMKHKDMTMRDFYDMFNHRLISLYYRAWKKYKHSLNYVTTNGSYSPYQKILSLLAGGESLHQLRCAGIFHRKVRNASDLEMLLRYYLECDVKIQQMVGQWQTLNPQEQTRLAGGGLLEGQHAALGVDAMLGQKVWDLSSQVNVVITCTRSEQAKQLLPGGLLHKVAKNILTDYLGHAVGYRLLIKAKYKDINTAQISKNSIKLGSSSFLAVRKTELNKTTQLSFKG